MDVSLTTWRLQQCIGSPVDVHFNRAVHLEEQCRYSIMKAALMRGGDFIRERFASEGVNVWRLWCYLNGKTSASLRNLGEFFYLLDCDMKFELVPKEVPYGQTQTDTVDIEVRP